MLLKCSAAALSLEERNLFVIVANQASYQSQHGWLAGCIRIYTIALLGRFMDAIGS